MKKILSILIMSMVYLFSTETKAKIVNVTEYDFSTNGLVRTCTVEDGCGKEQENDCPEDYPYSEKPEGSTSCTQTLGPNGKYCYKCTGPCENTAIYPYEAEDCGDLEPDETTACYSFTGEVRYKSCKCPSGWYKQADLTKNVSDATFTFDSNFKKSKNNAIICYRPIGCGSGKEKITKEKFSITGSKATYTENGGDSCTILTVDSLLKNTEDTNNFYCAKGHSCAGPCKDLATECVETNYDSKLASWYGMGCEYITGCKTSTGFCVSGSSSSAPSVAITSISAKKWTQSSNTQTTIACHKANGCNSDVTTSYLFGKQGLTIHESVGGIKSTPQSYATQTCMKYECNNTEGWIYADSAETGSVNVAILSQNGQYDISYVQNNAGAWFACKKEKPEPPSSGCFIGCNSGGWYHPSTQICSGTMTDKIFLGVDEDDSDVATVAVASGYTGLSYDDLTGINKNNYLTIDEVERISPLLKEKYGESQCFVTQSGPVKFSPDGIIKINSEKAFRHYCAKEETTCGIFESVIEIPDCLERDAEDLTKCVVCSESHVLVDGKCYHCWNLSVQNNKTCYLDNDEISNPCNSRLYPLTIGTNEVYACWTTAGGYEGPCPTGCTGCDYDTIDLDDGSYKEIETCTACADGYELSNGKCHKYRAFCESTWDEKNKCCSEGYDIDEDITSSSNTKFSMNVISSEETLVSIKRWYGFLGEIVWKGNTEASDLYLPFGDYIISWTSDNIVKVSVNYENEDDEEYIACFVREGAEIQCENANETGIFYDKSIIVKDKRDFDAKYITIELKTN